MILLLKAASSAAVFLQRPLSKAVVNGRDVPQVAAGNSSYRINVCGSVAEPACQKSAVCRVSGSGPEKMVSSFGISKVMTMDFKHEEQGILMEYGGGDFCPPSASLSRDHRLDSNFHFRVTQFCFYCSDGRWRALRLPLHVHEEDLQRVHERRAGG